MQRLRFIGRATRTGLQWARGVVSGVLQGLGVLLLFAGVAVAGVLIHQPAPVLGAFVGVVLLLIFAEGAFRVWRETEEQRAAAEPPVATEATAVWLSEQLSEGNEILRLWGPHAPRDIERDAYEEAMAWERTTQTGLNERLPAHAGHFGVDVGFGPEWYRAFIGETTERAALRRRIHRLAELAERYGRERAAA